MLKYETGNKSEAVVLSAYLGAGFTVSIPFGSGVIYDLLVDNGSKIFKIQVKTAWIRKDVVHINLFADNPKAKCEYHIKTAKLIL